jgi:biotin-dependent carboxylase-like uncharacterized protein
MIEVLSGGLYTSIQDLGRFGFRRMGVPLSGVMDSYSAKLANKLVGNSNREAVMEITHIGPVLKFNVKTEIAVTGAGFSPTLNNVEFPLNTRIYIPENSIVKFGLPGYGLRAYLAVSGGFKAEKVLNSYSQYHSLTKKETLEKGDKLEIAKFEGSPAKITASVKVARSHFTNDVMEVFPGPEFGWLSKQFQKKIMAVKLTVAPESNRMAYFIRGLEDFSAKEIITSPVQPGTVQLTPSGQCLILMRDAQTTGGYARPLQLSESAINVLSQKRTGQEFKFKLLDGD